MSKLFTLIFTGTLVAAGMMVVPRASFALTAELLSITPEPLQDVTSQIDTGDMPSGAALYAMIGELDQSYTATFSIDAEPAIVVTPGANISVDERYTYDATAGTLTVPFTVNGIIDDADKGVPDGYGFTMIVMVPAVTDDSQDGPPPAMIGSWFSTNLQDWELIPPSPEQIAFGFELSGPAGETGFFRMFMPDAIIALLSQYAETDLTAEDLAIFNNDAQSSLAVSSVTGGAYIDISVTFDEDSTAVVSAVRTADDTVTKTITAQPKQALSLAAKDSSVATGRTARLYGWLGSGRANQTIRLLRKLKGTQSYSLWRTVTTNADGYFSVRYTARKQASFKAKRGTLTSDAVTVSIN